MTGYAAMKERAADMIARKGAVVTLTYRAEGAYNPATGAAAQTETTEQAMGVLLPFSAGLRNMAGSTIEDGMYQLMLAALDTDGDALTEPRTNDTATIGGEEYTIAEVTKLAPDGTTALFYDCKVKS